MKNSNLKASTSPARLVEANYRWYIELYCPKRLRPTFNLNRILNLEERRKRGYHLCDLINFWITAGLNIDRFSEHDARRRMLESQQTRIAPRGHTPSNKALFHAVEIKRAKTRGITANSHESRCGVFVSFLEKKNWELIPIDEIQRHHIIAFMDYRQIIDKVANTTINNDLTTINTLMNELVDRGFIIVNPCDKIKKLPPEQKKRRRFSSEEAKVVLTYSIEKSPLLSLAILFQYCCFMRPNEIRKLQFKDVDLERNITLIKADKSKTGRKTGDRSTTIPTSFLPYFKKLLPLGQSNNYIFGVGFRPDQSEPCNKNRMYKTHKRILEQLLKDKKIDDIDGLQFYSWKDTGISDSLEYINLMGVRDQAGHGSANMTLKYYEKPIINEHMMLMKNTILG